MHIEIAHDTGLRVLKTWIYGTKRVYSLHENMEKAAEFGPRIDEANDAVAEYFTLTSIDPELIKRTAMMAKYTREIEACGENLDHFLVKVAEKRAILSRLAGERALLKATMTDATEYATPDTARAQLARSVGLTTWVAEHGDEAEWHEYNRLVDSHRGVS